MGSRAARTLVLVLAIALVAGGFTLARAAESTYEGVLTRLTVDPQDFKGGSRIDYTLTLADGTTKSVLPAEQAFGGRSPRSLDRKTVEVRGVEEKPGVIRASSIEHAGPASEDVGTQVTGTRPYAVVLCKFSDIPSEPHVPAYYTGLMGGSYPGMNHFYPAGSYSLLNVTGSAVYGWFTLPQPRSFYTVAGVPDFDEMLIFDHCTAAANPTVNFAAFHGINIMFNATANAALGGSSDSRTLDGLTRFWPTTWMPTWGHDSGTLAHEMGHSLGLPHSASTYTAHPNWPYDSDWDVMSGGLCNQIHPTYDCVSTGTIAFHKDIQGWIAPARKHTAVVGSTVVLRLWPLGDPAPAGTEYLMAQIPFFGAPATHFFTVELRRKRNLYDFGIPMDGVVVHDVDTTRGDGDARVVDHDGDGDANDDGAVLLPGEVFLQAGGARVEPLTSFPDGSMDVRISYRAAGAIILQSGGTTQVSEAGATDSYTVTLTSPPTANVTVTPSNGGGQLSVSPPTLTFTPGNWNVAQTVVVSAVNDSTPEPSPHIAVISHAVASADPAYSGLSIPSVSVAIIDNDGAVLITQSGGTTQVTEGGAPDTYTVVLAGPPSANVVVTPFVAGGQITFSPPSLTFTSGNWSVAQTVTVTAVDDAVDETSPSTSTITHTSASGDAGYNGIPVASVPVQVIDNDVAGVTVTQSGGTTQVTEGGAADSYTVVLTS
ncbi:MAG: hypothetical protein ACRDJM_03665, partial [Actinomycetota bacterium]